MRKYKVMRLLTLMLAVILLATSVGGVNVGADLNGDGKITVFDAQILLEAQEGLREMKEDWDNLSVASILGYILDSDVNPDVADLNGDGVLEIYTVEGLKYMAENPTKDYVLQNDLDLKGATWTPIQNFSGTFFSKGHTISNVVIQGNTQFCGFFGSTTAESIINSLNLRNATINASGNAMYIGLAVGLSRGTVKNLTVTGEIVDTRTKAGSSATIYTGAMVGSIVSGYVTGGTNITVTDEYKRSYVDGLAAEVSLRIQKGDKVKSQGLYGRMTDGCSITGDWCDRTNSAAAVSETMRERQQTVVDYMNKMATVRWTAQQKTTYLNHTQGNMKTIVIDPGEQWVGLPYNGRNGGMERFQFAMVNGDDETAGTKENPYVLNNAVFGTYSENNDGVVLDGWARYLGNDCSDAVGWAYMQVSPNRTQGATDNEYAGGHYLDVTRWMMPTTEDVSVPHVENGELTYNEDGSIKKWRYYGDNQERNGFYPVGDWTTVSNPSGSAYYNDSIKDTSKFAYKIPTAAEMGIPETDETITDVSKFILDYNGAEVMAEAYAVTRKGDCVVMYNGKGGHARLVTGYPVVIRSADGVLDPDRSYLTCTEQGDGLYDTKEVYDDFGKLIKTPGNTSWRLNFVWTFNDLMDVTNSRGYKHSSGVYLPITIRALRADYVKHNYVDEGTGNHVSNPVTGITYSNWRVVSATLTVADETGDVLFTYSDCPGVKSGHGGRVQNVNMNELFGESFKAFAESNLSEGTTYYFSVDIMHSNGVNLNLGRDCAKHSGEEFEPFTYTANMFNGSSSGGGVEEDGGSTDDSNTVS